MFNSLKDEGMANCEKHKKNVEEIIAQLSREFEQIKKRAQFSCFGVNIDVIRLTPKCCK